MLDIIIPCYNSHKTIDYCLGSLLMQTYKNFRVTLVNDCGKPYDDVLQRYSKFFPIQQITYETNMGPGYARQFGIEHTNNQYIMFLDSDDCLVGPFVIETIYSKLNKLVDCGVLNNALLKEYENGSYTTLFKNNNYLHGKVYNRNYLKTYDIKFPNSSCCEDASFTLQCDLIQDSKFKTHYTQDIAYCWVYNKESLGRKDIITWEHKIVVTGYVDNLIYTFNQIERFQKSELIDLHKILYMIRLVIIYADNCKYFPQFEDDNLRDLKKY